MSIEYCRILRGVPRILNKSSKNAESMFDVPGTGDYFGVNHVTFSRVGHTPFVPNPSTNLVSLRKVDNFLLMPSSARMWLGSATLAGLLLASGLPTLASTQTQTTILRSPAKPTRLASTVVSTGTYTETVRKQLQWITSPVTTSNKESVTASKNSVSTQSNSATVAAQPKKTTQTTQTNKKSTKPEQVAAASKQQVSRSDSSKLMDHAQSLAGTPYVFGGTSRKGFDCSGYTQYVFKASGVSLPRTAAEQFNVGSSVSRAQLQSGDLVFFTTYAKGASHVGIYIGGGRFISASNSGVSTSSLVDGYYASRYLGARRVR